VWGDGPVFSRIRRFLLGSNTSSWGERECPWDLLLRAGGKVRACFSSLYYAQLSSIHRVGQPFSASFSLQRGGTGGPFPVPKNLFLFTSMVIFLYSPRRVGIGFSRFHRGGPLGHLFSRGKISSNPSTSSLLPTVSFS